MVMSDTLQKGVGYVKGKGENTVVCRENWFEVRIK